MRAGRTDFKEKVLERAKNRKGPAPSHGARRKQGETRDTGAVGVLHGSTRLYEALGGLWKGLYEAWCFQSRFETMQFAGCRGIPPPKGTLAMKAAYVCL